jgi:predicted HicB family RNase H-like nuclease
VTVTVTYSDGLWVYANESLNLWGYADRREDALRDLHESFDYMYREIAEEAEESLDNLAKQLKRRLRGLVVLPDGGSVTRA